MTKRFIIAIVLLVVVGGGLIGFNLFREQAIKQFFANMPVPTVTVSTVEIQPITWTPGIEAIGTVGAAQGVDLTVETTGIVKAVLFAANQRVAKGDILVQLDDTVQRADLAAAEAQAALDKEALERAERLRERGVNTEVSVDAARTAASASAAQVEKLKAILDQKQVRAPFAGTMGIPKIDQGQYLAPGTIVATLQDIETMRADFSVPEQELGSLKVGLPVAFGLSENDMPFRGAVVGVDPKVDPQSRLVAVRAEIANPEGRLTPGQFIRVRVELPDEANVIAIPQTALVSSLYGDFVFTVQAKAAAEGEQPTFATRQIFVNSDRRNGGLVEITKGLQAGDQVVTAGQNRLSNGTPVAIDNTVNTLPGAANAAIAE